MTTSRVTGGQYIREMYVVRRTWSGSCDSAAGAGERSAKLEPLNLARRRLGQLRDELDPARILVGCELVLHEALELSFEAGSGGRAVLEDDEGLGLDEAVRVLVAHPAVLEAGWPTSVFSTSTGETQMPPTLSMSSARPQYQKKPSASW